MNLGNFLFLACACIVPSTWALARLPSAETQQALERHLRHFATVHHIPCFVAGYQVYTAPEHHQRWTFNSDGFANVENSVKCSKETMLRVASVSKAVGSALIGSLVEQGKLHWDDDIHKYVPERIFPKKTWQGSHVSITLRHLISHLAGLRQTTDADLLHEYNLHLVNSTQTVAWFSNEPLLSKPGTKFKYSNAGWSLLAAAVEAVEGAPYHKVLNDFLRKMGMKKAQQDDRREVIENRGLQYSSTVNEKGVFHLHPAPITDHLRPFPFWPAAGIISTVEDLLIFGGSILRSANSWSGGHLKPATVHDLWSFSPKVAEGNQSMTIEGHHYSVPHHYALGWYRLVFPATTSDSKLAHLEMLYHVGNVGGANSILAVLPKENVVLAAISNLGGIKQYMPEIAVEMYRILRQ